ncbi:MAG TPA: nuclear transport factor 2 family protein [Actinoplanes sp.]|jgi:predicted ester cyclase
MTTAQTLGERYIRAVAAPDFAEADDLFADDVVFYTPFARGARGRDFIKAFIGAFHQAMPGLRASLHDEFSSADGSRVTLRLSIHWHNTGSFMGNPPTGASGVESEIHTLRLDGGRIVECWVGHNTLDLTYHQLVTWGMKLPEDSTDPAPELISVSATALPAPAGNA